MQMSKPRPPPEVSIRRMETQPVGVSVFVYLFTRRSHKLWTHNDLQNGKTLSVCIDA